MIVSSAVTAGYYDGAIANGVNVVGAQ